MGYALAERGFDVVVNDLADGPDSAEEARHRGARRRRWAISPTSTAMKRSSLAH
ncbi:MAG: hypothetical protein U1F68_17060 [Gammaproteobacteria bacterium]